MAEAVVHRVLFEPRRRCDGFRVLAEQHAALDHAVSHDRAERIDQIGTLKGLIRLGGQAEMRVQIPERQDRHRGIELARRSQLLEGLQDVEEL